jgi:hypothetical protein
MARETIHQADDCFEDEQGKIVVAMAILREAEASQVTVDVGAPLDEKMSGPA